MIRSSMVATDLCEQLEVEMQRRLSVLVHSGQFSWSNSEHSGLFRYVNIMSPINNCCITDNKNEIYVVQMVTLTVCSVADLAKHWTVHKRVSQR